MEEQGIGGMHIRPQTYVYIDTIYLQPPSIFVLLRTFDRGKVNVKRELENMGIYQRVRIVVSLSIVALKNRPHQPDR